MTPWNKEFAETARSHGKRMTGVEDILAYMETRFKDNSQEGIESLTIAFTMVMAYCHVVNPNFGEREICETLTLLQRKILDPHNRDTVLNNLKNTSTARD